MVELTAQQQSALDACAGQVLQVVDPRSQQVFVVLPLERFAVIQQLLEDRTAVQDTYVHLDEVLGKNGWNDPAMDVYDQYTTKRP